MEYAVPQPPSESETFDGIAYHLWLPVGEGPHPAVAVLHGAGSQKENHADFARAAINHGFAALTFDNRGHGETEGALGPRVVADIQKLLRMLGDRPEVDGGRIALRGSSMGGLLALHVAAVSAEVAAVVAICPASEEMLLEDLRRVARGESPPTGSALESMRVDVAGLVPRLEEHDVRQLPELIGSTPLMIVHARGDEVVPYELSEQLFERAAEPKRLLLLEGGDHRSAQHDAEIQGETLRWLSRMM
jgi:pimeloyl-ACP methyl ester carboxylesterase